MLSLMFMVLFMMPMSLISGCWWLVQNLLLVFTFFMMFKLGNGMSYLSYLFGVDTMSYGMIVLSGWISFLMVLASQSVFKTSYMSEIFMFVLLMLLLLLMMAFSSLDLFGFYLFFEGSLIPILLLILGWGYQPERLQSGIYLLFYTLLASLPLLIGVFFLNFNLNSLIMLLFDNNSDYKMIFYLGMIMAFLVKMPMFMLHLWLPKAHVEAPVSGSMILAGVLLKLGGYGLLRILILFMKVGISMSFIWISISLIGGFLVSLMCLCQIDLKALVAYSSVAHMGIVLSGMMSLTYWGLFGSYTLMIAHGLCSSGLFCLVNIVYDRLGSRSLLINKGLLNLMPSLALWWFLLCSSNMAAPPSLNLLGEIELLNSIVSWSLLSMVFLMLISFFSASYSLYLFSYSQHGKSFSGSYSFSYCNVREFMLVLMHWVPLNLLILKPDFCVFWL